MSQGSIQSLTSTSCPLAFEDREAHVVLEVEEVQGVASLALASTRHALADTTTMEVGADNITF